MRVTSVGNRFDENSPITPLPLPVFSKTKDKKRVNSKCLTRQMNCASAQRGCSLLLSGHLQSVYLASPKYPSLVASDF
jgi:hypothetical protein